MSSTDNVPLWLNIHASIHSIFICSENISASLAFNRCGCTLQYYLKDGNPCTGCVLFTGKKICQLSATWECYFQVHGSWGRYLHSSHPRVPTDCPALHWAFSVTSLGLCPLSAPPPAMPLSAASSVTQPVLLFFSSHHRTESLWLFYCAICQLQVSLSMDSWKNFATDVEWKIHLWFPKWQNIPSGPLQQFYSRLSPSSD